VCALISLPLTYLSAPLDPYAGSGESFAWFFEGFKGRSLASVAALILVVLLLAPLFVVLWLYVAAAIYQVLVGIFVGSENAGFDATLRVYAYASVVELLVWIPVAGYFVGLYGLFLKFLGVREVHGATTVQALSVISVPAGFWLLLIFGGSIIQFIRG
jgi:hypothetical protein